LLIEYKEIIELAELVSSRLNPHKRQIKRCNQYRQS